MTDDNLRDALQGMRQPQPGIVYIADVLAYVEPELKRLQAELPKCNGMCPHASDVGVSVDGDPVAYEHRSCPEHGDLETVAQELDAALTEAEADRDRARDAAVALEQQLAEIKKLAYMGGQNGEVIRAAILGVFEGDLHEEAL